MRFLLFLLVIAAIAGCSNRAVYENLQINRRNECMRLPFPEQERCMARIDQSYEEYKQAREDYLRERERELREEDVRR